MCLSCGSQGLPERRPTHPVGLDLDLNRIRDQRAAAKFCSAGWGGHRDADKFWQVPRFWGNLWCVKTVNQQHRGGETGTGGREGGREGGRGETGKKGGGGGGTKGSAVIQSVTQTTSSADTQYLSLQSVVKGPLTAFSSLISRAGWRRTTGLRFYLTGCKFESQVSPSGAVV